MHITINTLSHSDKFDVLRIFKTEDHRILFLANIGIKFLLIELVAFNYLTVVNEIPTDLAGEWSVSLDNEILKYKKLDFAPIEDEQIEMLLDQKEYYVIFKQDGQFYQLQNAEFEPQKNLPPPKNFPFKLPFPGTILRLLLKQTNLIDDITIDEYLDRIRHVGINNLTPQEKHGLDLLSQL